jgi:hypothetical protein
MEAREAALIRDVANTPHQLHISRLWPRSARAVSVDGYHPFASSTGCGSSQIRDCCRPTPMLRRADAAQYRPKPFGRVFEKREIGREKERFVAAVCGSRKWQVVRWPRDEAGAVHEMPLAPAPRQAAWRGG